MEQKATAATERFHKLSDQIKSTEAALHANMELKAATVQYAKTRSVFEMYKASKYSKKFLVEHEADIELYRAACADFKAILGGAKLPKTDTLKEEGRKLAEQKKKLYAESRKAKEAEREAEEKSRLGMNIRRGDSVWRAELPSSEARPDELRPLERRHVVRAYADFMDSDDASLTIGPELMLKDEHNEWGKKSRPEENDPSVGLGMQFSLDF